MLLLKAISIITHPWAASPRLSDVDLGAYIPRGRVHNDGRAPHGTRAVQGLHHLHHRGALLVGHYDAAADVGGAGVGAGIRGPPVENGSRAGPGRALQRKRENTGPRGCKGEPSALAAGMALARVRVHRKH